MPLVLRKLRFSLFILFVFYLELLESIRVVFYQVLIAAEVFNRSGRWFPFLISVRLHESDICIFPGFNLRDEHDKRPIFTVDRYCIMNYNVLRINNKQIAGRQIL